MKTSEQTFAQIVSSSYAISYLKIVEIGKYLFKPSDTEYVDLSTYG